MSAASQIKPAHQTDMAHIEGEVAAAAANAPPRKNKACPCPNCRQPAKGAGSFTNTTRGGAGAAGSGKQQAAAAAQQQQQKGGSAGAGASGGGKSGAKGGKPEPPAFNVSALPSKSLMNAATTKDVQGPKPKPKQDSLKIKIRKQLARLIKRKKE